MMVFLKVHLLLQCFSGKGAVDDEGILELVCGQHGL